MRRQRHQMFLTLAKFLSVFCFFFICYKITIDISKNVAAVDNSTCLLLQPRHKAKSKNFIPGTPWQEFPYLVKPNFTFCRPIKSKNFPLLIVVASRPDGFNLRKTIRETYARTLAQFGVHPVFLIGRENKFKAEVEKEAKKHGDLLVADFVDTYQNLSLKTFVALNWADDVINDEEQCVEGETRIKPVFFMKMDDDVFVYVKQLLKYLNGHTDANMTALCFKHEYQSARVGRDPKGKWYVPKETYFNDNYPSYCDGHAYVLTTDSIKPLLNYVQPLNWYFYIEDVLFTGIAREATGVVIINDHRFGYGWTRPEFTLHYETADRIRKLHSQLNDSKVFVF